MSGLELHLESATSRDCIEQVTSFVAEDASGSFGILPGHERMVTVVEFGMSRFRVRLSQLGHGPRADLHYKSAGYKTASM